jgi:hypothetical protein
MNTKHIILSVLIAAFLFLSSKNSSAQFNNGSILLGPHIGLSGVGSQPTFGANFEVGVTDPGKAGPGIIGISGRLDYWSWSETYWKWTWITLAAFANYHFALEDKRWDLFLGLGFGYENVSTSYSGDPLFNNSAYGSGIIFAGNAGARYFFSPNFAARALAGFGLTWLVLGVDFGLN